jgi:carbonic anhydrase
MKKLIAGYRRFLRDVYPEQKSRFKQLASSQKPHTLFITCSDSRVVPSMITQSDPGELFICRVVGNLVPAHAGAGAGGVTSAVEYAVMVLGVKDIIVCGHSDCGAMRAFSHPEKLASLPSVASWLEHASTAIMVSNQMYGHLADDEFLLRLTQENVVSQLQHLRTHPAVAIGLRQGTLGIHGWYYDIGTGVVSAYDDERKEFLPLDKGLEVIQAGVSEPAIA